MAERPHRLPLRINRAALALIAALVARALPTPAAAAEPDAAVTAWLNAQTNLQSWSADFTQTRTLKSLVQPLQSTGRVWFAAPNRFRWELGDPPRTIAVRQTNALYVIYPGLKRAERYPLDAGNAGPWRDTLALLDAGFPRSRADLESRYQLLSQTVTNGAGQVVLQPKSASARRMIPQITIGFAINDSSLQSTELQFADGSTMRNDFTNTVVNPAIDESRFTPDIAGDYKVVEPLKQ